MPASKNQNYLHGAAILAIATIVTKILGAIYKIPLGNILGDEGFAHFNVAYNLYNVLLALSTAGLPIAVARLISESNNLKKPAQINRIYKIAVITFVTLGMIGSLIMFLFPVDLATRMGDAEASQGILAMAPAVLLVCICSAFRGYTEGLSDMRPTSVSQVIEVLFKVISGLTIVILLQRQGYDLPILSAGAICGTGIGALFASIYLGFVVRKRRKYELALVESAPENYDMSSDTSGVIFKKFVNIGVPIALGSCVLSVVSLINQTLIFDRLQNAAGCTFAEAKTLFGVYSKALTLYNLPAAIITPMTISVIPAITGFLARKQYEDARNVVESSLRISTIIALPMAIGLSVCAQPIMDGLYYGSAAEGPQLLAIMGLASYFVSLALMTTAILQAGGRERLPMYTMLTGCALDVLLFWLLVGNPDIHIFGGPIATLLCYILMSGLNLWFVMHRLPEKPNLAKVFVLPVINCAVMGAAVRVAYPAFMKLLGAGDDPGRKLILAGLLLTILVGIAVYLVMTILTRAVTMEDMKLIPKGEAIGKKLHIR
ncbi:MAG: putative polysaccharide biosynthesis protein [Oscillospiraceae bacterium]|jgi:stage V sporulation protein B